MDDETISIVLDYLTDAVEDCAATVPTEGKMNLETPLYKVRRVRELLTREKHRREFQREQAAKQ
jgi:hypothetical protein